MRRFLKITYIIWCFITIIISLFLFFFEGIKLYDYFTNEYNQSRMKISSINFYSSSGKRDVADVDGEIGKKKVYFSLYDDDIEFILEYLEDVPGSVLKKIKYNELEKIDFFVPVIKFLNSENVILVYKNKTTAEAIQNWIMPKIILFAIAYLPLILLLFLNKNYSKND